MNKTMNPLATEEHIPIGVASVRDRYNAARRKLQREGRKFAGIRIITSHTIGSDETLPAGSRSIKDVINKLEARSNRWVVFTNFNNEVAIQDSRLK